MNEFEILLVLVLGTILLTGVMILSSNYKNRKLFFQQAEQNWGRAPDISYTADQLERLSVYGKEKCAGEPFFIDEITWKDLDLNRIFLQMNHTVSAPGEEYLMYLLRTPRLEEEKLWERDRLIQWLSENKEKRLALQFILSGVPKNRFHSIGEQLQSLRTASAISVNKHRILCALAAVCLLFMLYQPVYGFFLFLAAACVNIADYYAGSDRKAAGAYLGCFRSVLQMMDSAGKTEKISWKEIEKHCCEMGTARKNLRPFQNSARCLLGIGGPEAAVAELIRMIFHVDLICYNKMLKEIQRHQKDAEILLESLGGLDCMAAIGSYREMLPAWCRPSFQNQRQIQAGNLYHPLVASPTANSFQLQSSMLLTGSNASGKSTFLKSVALNAILAQTAVTCTADFYQAPLCRIITSMALSDNLETGESYFVAEIKSLKRMIDTAGREGWLLCMADEVLRGTNTIERIAASSEILYYLCRENVFCFAATHDIELTYLLENCYKNYHFDEEITGKDVSFPYILREGRASSRNAIRLLSIMGYGKKITAAAENTARVFETTGVWKKKPSV